MDLRTLNKQRQLPFLLRLSNLTMIMQSYNNYAVTTTTTTQLQQRLRSSNIDYAVSTPTCSDPRLGALVEVAGGFASTKVDKDNNKQSTVNNKQQHSEHVVLQAPYSGRSAPTFELDRAACTTIW